MFVFTEITWVLFVIFLTNSVLARHWIFYIPTLIFGMATFLSGFTYESDKPYINKLSLAVLNLNLHFAYLSGKIWFCLKNRWEIKRRYGYFRFF